MQTNKEEIINLENKFWQAMKDKDIDGMLAMTDDPCVVTGAQGVGEIDKKTFAKMMSEANYTLNDFSISEPVVRFLNDDVAILAYKVHEDLTVDGKPVSLDAADASTWIRKNGSWVCSMHTESLAGDPYGRDRKLN